LKAFSKSFSNFTVGLIGVTLLVAAAIGIYACSYDPCEDRECQAFFSFDVIQIPKGIPFPFRQKTYHSLPVSDPNVNQQTLSEVDSVNLDEWATYLTGIVPKSELSDLVYGPADLQAAAAKYGKQDRVVHALEYLQLAKEVEPIATLPARNTWQQPVPTEFVNIENVKALIDRAENAARNSDKFLAQRYRFQAIRLMFYSGQSADAQQYFERYKGTFTEENSPKYRFMSTAAGAYYKDKKYGQANYLYSIVFDRFPPLVHSAYISFHPMEDGDWNETIALAKNAHEREVLWELLGLHTDGSAAIDGIYAMNPKSKVLPLILVREVNRAEHDWFGRHDGAAVGATRLATIKSIADAGNADKPYLWDLAAGHLLALAGDSKTAETYLDKASKTIPNVPELQTQLRMSLLLARVRNLQAIDRSQEPYLAGELQWLQKLARSDNDRAINLNQWSLADLSGTYLKGGDPVRALMLNDSPSDNIYRSVRGVDPILAFMRNASTPFDRFLVANYPYSVEQIQELRGLEFLYAGDFANAVEAFKLAGSPTTKDLKADPFTIHIKDCHQCDRGAQQAHYTKLSFAERMLALSRTAQRRGEDAAAASFDLANGFYNMSYYGNGRDIYETDRRNLVPSRDGNREAELSLNMNLAEKYYLQALNLTSNPEFKARAAFMAAKTEQNRYYYTEHDVKAPQPRTYFKLLKDSYSSTQYYSEIIQECERFRKYIGQ
jgi:hypothetical protein